MEDDKQIQLGLEDVTRDTVVSAATTSSAGTRADGSSPTDPRLSDPLFVLLQSGAYQDLLAKVEPAVESMPAAALNAEKLWWLRASVKLGTPEPFLLGSVSEISSNSVPRRSPLGVLISESVMELHAAGAVLLASELTRILESSVVISAAVSADGGGNPPATVQSRDGALQSGLAASAQNRAGISTARLGALGLIALIVIGFTVSQLWSFGTATLGDFSASSNAGPEARGVAAIAPPSLSPPALAPVAPPSALDRVLVALDEGRKSLSSSSGVSSNTTLPGDQVGVAASAKDATNGAGSTQKTIQLSSINWDGPLEPEDVKQAIAEGDTVVNEEDATARKLFGDPQPVTEQRGSGTSTPSRDRPLRDRLANSTADEEPRKLPRIVEYEAVVRAIASREPKFTSPRVMTLEPGDRVFVDQRDGAFLRIRLAGGGSAYVLSQDLERVND